MLMRAIEVRGSVASYPEVAGVRVLVTGLTSELGVDLVRAFADHHARLVVQSPDQDQAITELAALLAESAGSLKFFNTPLADPEAAVRLAQSAAETLGGIDAVVNLVTFDPRAVARGADMATVEGSIADTLRTAALISRVAANRMRVTLTEGMILNVVAADPQASGGNSAYTGMVHAALASMTRGEAKAWAGEGIRVHAVGPGSGIVPGHRPASGADIAALALYLASRKGRGLTGHVFDPEGIAGRSCL